MRHSHTWLLEEPPRSLANSNCFSRWSHLQQGAGYWHLNTPPKGGDAWIILAQKVIAGKLSMLADPDPQWDAPSIFPETDTFEDLIRAADTWLGTHSAPCGPGSPGRATGLALAADIDYWLNYYD